MRCGDVAAFLLPPALSQGLGGGHEACKIRNSSVSSCKMALPTNRDTVWAPSSELKTKWGNPVIFILKPEPP